VLGGRHRQGLEQAELLGAGCQKTLDVFALSLSLHRPLKREPLEHPLRRAVDVGQLEPLAHESLDVKCHQTYGHMGPDPAIHKMLHGPYVERAVQDATTALYVLKVLMLQD
jgi:hypothetical protein